MSWLVALPIALPLATACLGVALRASRRAQQGACVLGASVLVGVALALLAHVDREGYLVLHVGNWPAPFGIALVADRFAALMVLVSAVAGLGATLYALDEEPESSRRPNLLPLMQVLLMGVCGAFLTGDLFNLYVWFEVLLMASFVLLTLGNSRAQLRAAFIYVVLNLLSSILFLVAAGLIYGVAGTLNIADLGRVLSAAPANAELATIGVLLLIAFGIKAALVPVFFWLPASYHTPSFAVSALFSALLTKVGVYSIYRVFLCAMPLQGEQLRDAMAIVAALSMVVGVLGAASQQNIRRILAFHSVSQMGYLLMGLAIGTPEALAAGAFFFVHHALVKANLFLIAGAIDRATGSNDLRNERVAGLARTMPWLAGAFLVTALSLAGIPPMTGFAAKLGLISAGLDARAYVLVGVATLVGLLTMFSMVKIWSEAFWREREAAGDSTDAPAPSAPRYVPTLVAVPLALGVGTLALGVLAGPLLQFCVRAGEQLVDRRGYERAVGLAGRAPASPAATASPAAAASPGAKP